jgi:hypothetical protein
MQFMSLILASCLLMAGCSTQKADVCETHSGVVFQWVPPQESFWSEYPEMREYLNQPVRFQEEMEERSFVLKTEKQFEWAFDCDLDVGSRIASADYALRPATEDHQEGYMIGYDESGNIVAISNRFNYRAL